MAPNRLGLQQKFSGTDFVFAIEITTELSKKILKHALIETNQKFIRQVIEQQSWMSESKTGFTSDKVLTLLV